MIINSASASVRVMITKIGIYEAQTNEMVMTLK